LGTRVTCKGISITTIKTKNNLSLNGNRNFAKAYAANTPTITWMITMGIVIIAEFKNINRKVGFLNKTV